jgi:MFS family permease
MWGLSFQAMFKAAGYNLLVTFLPALLEYAYHVPRDQAGGLTSWSLATFVAGSMLGGWMIDHVLRLTKSKYYSRSGVAGATLVLAAIFSALAGFAGSGTAMAAWLAAAGLFAGMAGAAPWAATMDIGGANTAVVMGFMNSFSALSGVLISPLVGRLIDFTKSTGGDWRLIFWLHAGFYLVAAASWLTVDPERAMGSRGAVHAV